MIDWSRLEQLKEEVGADDFEEVVSLFLEEADEAVEQLSSSFPADVLEASFHALKGSALNLGFADLADLCATAERLAAKGDVESIEFEAAKTIYATSKKALTERSALA